jgi:hypothetical protein
VSGLPEIELRHLLDPLDHLFAELPALAELANAHPDAPVPYTPVEPRMPEPLTDDMRALLAAVHDALDVPLPALTDADERAYLRILRERTAVARIAIGGILHDGSYFGAADYLTGRTAQVPITYTTFKAAEQTPRCGRCRWTFDPRDTRWDGHARYGDTPWCRRCVDVCHDGGAEHVCAICDPARYGHKQDGGQP